MSSCRIKAERVISSAPLKFASSFFIFKWKKKKTNVFCRSCCCKEVPSVKQKVIAGNSFVDRPLRLLCKEAGGTELWFLWKPPRSAYLVFWVDGGSNENLLSWHSRKAAPVLGNEACLMAGEDCLPFRQMGLIWLPSLPKLQKLGWGKPCELN